VKDLTIYHNPRCSKSRATLELLREHGVEPKVIEYLQTPPTAAELRAIVARLGIEPEALVRRNEDVFKQKYAGKTLTGEQWIAAMVADPILIERPIVVAGDAAVIGRPPENAQKLLR
jgi:arsenate reductase (glutaredoxin)